MTDLLDSGLEWLSQQLSNSASRQVTYRRGSDLVVVSATIGRSLLKLDDGAGGIRMEWTDRDFLIRAALLVLAGLPVEPERGDEILETVGANVATYEVMAYGGEPPWRYSDPFRHMFRIHTKFVGIESP